MPAIDLYTCENCNETTEHFRPTLADDPCPMINCECGNTAFYDFGATVKPSRPKASNFEPYWEEHIAPQPVYIDSKNTLEREMKKTGVQLTKAHKRAPEYCRQGSAMTAPTPAQRMSWLNDRS